MSRRAHIAVTVKEENIDKKLRQFKKKIEREGVIRDAKRMVYFESKSQKNRKRLLRAKKVESTRRTMQGL
jgi:small subunit ribosomal protein S21